MLFYWLLCKVYHEECALWTRNHLCSGNPLLLSPTDSSDHLTAHLHHAYPGLLWQTNHSMGPGSMSIVAAFGCIVGSCTRLKYCHQVQILSRKCAGSLAT